jgi:hypothetical protein
VTDSRLAVAVTGIVTDSTTGIDTVKLLAITKCTIISTGLEGIGVSGGVAPLCKLQRSYTLAHSIPGQTQNGTDYLHAPCLLYSLPNKSRNPLNNKLCAPYMLSEQSEKKCNSSLDGFKSLIIHHIV